MKGRPLIRLDRNKDCTKMFLRGELMWLTPFDSRYVLGQTAEHNVMSPRETHVWETGAQVRTCRKCFLQECCPPTWVPIPHGKFSTSDIEELIRLHAQY